MIASQGAEMAEQASGFLVLGHPDRITSLMNGEAYL